MLIALSASPREQQSHHLDIETAQIQSLFERFLERHTHIDDPTEVHRSMARVPVAFLFVASVPPRNDRKCLASALVPATVRSGVEPPKAPGFLVSAPSSAPS